MQGTVVMLLALSGLGCHHKKVETTYADSCYSSCYSLLLVVLQQRLLLVLLQRVELLLILLQRVELLLILLLGRGVFSVQLQLLLLLQQLLQLPSPQAWPVRPQAALLPGLLRPGPGPSGLRSLRLRLEPARVRDVHADLRWVCHRPDAVGPRRSRWRPAAPVPSRRGPRGSRSSLARQPGSGPPATPPVPAAPPSGGPTPAVPAARPPPPPAA